MYFVWYILLIAGYYPRLDEFLCPPSLNLSEYVTKNQHFASLNQSREGGRGGIEGEGGRGGESGRKGRRRGEMKPGGRGEEGGVA